MVSPSLSLDLDFLRMPKVDDFILLIQISRLYQSRRHER
jgi:hypothetical protein